ncbi:MAG: hypothetical protein KKG75_04435 [Nanoarchaeota archaeon]|nr:hypothetical protein [Nanoarchaeota archaeon]
MELDKITMKRSPYLVEPSINPQQALKYAIEKGLFEYFKIDKELVADYLNSKKEIPIWIIETACNINKNNFLIPIKYQHLWYCLNEVKVKRFQPSGNIFNPKVSFVPVYIRSNKKIRNLIDKVTLYVKKNRFVELSGFKFRKGGIFSQWRNRTIPITAIMKACQIAGENFLDLIDNSIIEGVTNKNGAIIFNKRRNKDLETILFWIKTEGHVQIYSTHISISQKEQSQEKLKILSKLFQNTFKLNKKSVVINYNKSWKGHQLCISSAPLRQILNLIYKIPLGYKTNCNVDEKIDFNKYSKEEKLKILSSFCETEGSFYNTLSHGKFISPRFEFKIYDRILANNFIQLLKTLNYNGIKMKYNKKNKIFCIGIYNFNNFLKLCFDLQPHLSKGTNKKILNILSTKDLIARVKFKSENISDLIKEIRNKTKYKRDFIKNIKKEYPLNHNSKYAVDWIKNGAVPLSAIIYSCKLKNKNIFNYTPKHIAILLKAQNLLNQEKFEVIRNA